MPLSHGYRGVSFREALTWHRQEMHVPLSGMVRTCTGDDLVLAGQWCGALPIQLTTGLEIMTADGAPGVDPRMRGSADFGAVVASYGDGDRQIVGLGGRHHDADALPMLIRAAYATGLCTPTGLFSMRDRRSVVATLAIKTPGDDGLCTTLTIADHYDGKCQSTGASTVDSVCDNTWACALSKDGHKWAEIKHTSSFSENVRMLSEKIGEAIQAGSSVRSVYEQARHAVLSPAAWQIAFDRLWPEAPPDGTKKLITRALNKREEAKAALRAPINRRGMPAGAAGILANTATWLVNHRADGSPRASRGCELESELYGSRAERTVEVIELVKELLADGSTRYVENVKPISMVEAVQTYRLPLDQVLGCSVLDLDMSPVGENP